MALAAIAIFSVGEMMSSPKFSEFIGNFAPDDKKAMYLGFSQIPVGVGWTIEGKVGPWLYEVYASKDQFSRDLLGERGMTADAIEQIPQGEAFTRLVEFTGESATSLTQILHDSHNVRLARGAKPRGARAIMVRRVAEEDAFRPPARVWADLTHETDELFMFIDGEVELEVRGNTVRPAQGEEIFIAKGVVHTVRNVGSTTSYWFYAYERR